MTTPDIPQIYLITPTHCELDFYRSTLPALLDAHPIACLRLGFRGEARHEISKHADHLRDLAHQYDIPVLITDHYKLVGDLGLDGVHRREGVKHLRDIRKTLGRDAIIGTYCANSRHEGIIAGEIGADYVSFGPLQTSPIGAPDPVDTELFSWWSQMIELPVVAEGHITPALAREIAPLCDFIALGEELWQGSTPPEAVFSDYLKAIF